MHGLDHQGRITSTSNVDEAVFGKSPMGNRLHNKNMVANFNINERGATKRR